MYQHFKTDLWRSFFYRMLIALGLLGLGRILFHLINIEFFADMSVLQLLRAYWGGLRFDLATLAYLNMAYSLAMLLPMRFRSKPLYEKISYWLYFIPNAVGFFANLCDTMYYPFTLKRSTMSVFSEFENEGPGLLLDLMAQFWYMGLLAVAVLLLFYFLSRRIRYTSTYAEQRANKVYYPTHMLVMLLLVLIFVVSIRGGIGMSWRPMTPTTANIYVDKLEQRALVLNTPYCFIRTVGKQVLEKKPYFIPEEELEKRYNPVRRFDADSSKQFAALKGRNVMILIVESFGREFVGSLNKHIPGYKGYTPNFDTLAAKGYLFANAYANGRKSIDAMPSIFSSLPSLGLHFINSHYSGNRVEGLPDLLAKRWNYHSCFYHGAPNGSMGFDAYSMQIGFNSYFGKDEYANDDDYDGAWGIWDEPFLQRVCTEIGKQPQPFMATVFTLSSHNPFKVPKEYEGVFPKGEVPLIQCIGYADHALGQFFAEAAKQPWFENTLFVVTADHASESALPVYKTPYNRFAIPLLIYAPGSELQGFDTHTLVQHSDILPTVLNLLGYDKPVFSFGRNMFDTSSKPRFVVNDYDGTLQWMQGDYYLQYDGNRSTGLYNYRQDPLLKTNLKDKMPLLRDSLTKQLRIVEQSYNERIRNDRLKYESDYVQRMERSNQFRENLMQRAK